MTTTRKLSNCAMQSILTIRSWNATRTDKRLSREQTSLHNAKRGSMRTRKDLVDRKGSSLAEINRVANEARAYHYAHTVPYIHKGPGVLPATLAERYMEAMRRLREEFDIFADDFEHEYPRLIEGAKIDLNGAFDPGDYPDPLIIRDRFGIDIKLIPFPDMDGSSIAADQSVVDMLAESAAELEHQAMETVTSGCYAKLQDVVTSMRDGIKKYSVTSAGKVRSPFRDTLINNVHDVISVLSDLNLAEDPTLEALRADTEQALNRVSAGSLRTSETEREALAAKADAILSRMAGYCGSK